MENTWLEGPPMGLSPFLISRAVRRHSESRIIPCRYAAWFFSETEGSTVFSASDDYLMHVYDIRTGELTGTVPGHTGIVCAVDVSPNGTTLASASGDGTVKIWDRRTLGCTHTFEGFHSDIVWSVKFYHGGSRLVSASDDGTLRFWNVSE
mmetsp:Transcript_2356/g.4062  ORF Transcript_2356/g.4062 Transcript_2356/m.4062 type:complete len:150 (+) Transcript_2356:412-861(+)